MDVLSLVDRPIAFHRIFVDLTGSITAALFLSQAIYWQRRVPDERDGWWFKSQAEWTDETGLSRREQETARSRLREVGVLQEERRGVPAKLWYRIDVEKLSALLIALTSKKTGYNPDGRNSPPEPNSASGSDEQAVSMSEPAILDCTPKNPFKNTRLSESASLECQASPIKVQNGGNRQSGLAETADQDGPIPPISKRKQRLQQRLHTETTTQPPPQTPPPSQPPRCDRGECSGGENVSSIEGHAEADLVFPHELSALERQAASKILADCPVNDRQAILDVLAATIRAGEVRKSALSVLNGLVRRVRNRTFDPTPGLHIAIERRRRAQIQAVVHASSRRVLQAVVPKQGPPIAHIQALKRALHGNVSLADIHNSAGR